MELVERERYLADLKQWLHAAVESGGSIALVGGEAGVGKTALLQEFSDQQREARTLWGACDALFTPRPLAPLYDIARQARGALLAAVNSGASRDAIFTATLDELERGGAALVVFEDMHWADEATLDLLKFLGRRIHRIHALLAVTYRDDEVDLQHPLRAVIGDLPRASTHRLSLLPLSESAVAQLARRSGRPSQGLHKATGGNPLFVTEVLAGSDDTVPITVRDAVLARAARLSPVAREIAEFVCVCPGKTESWLLEEAAGQDPGAIENCLSVGMVRYDDGSLGYRHELARRALEDSLPQTRRLGLHSKVLAALARHPDTPAARLAHHADGARNSQEVLRYAPIAGSQAAALGAHREAASHFEAALRYARDLTPDERARLQEKLSYEYFLTNQVEAAIDARSGALAIWRASGARRSEGDSLRWLSRLSWSALRRADANQFAIDAVTTLESLPPGLELAMAYSNRAQLDMLSHELDSAIAWAQKAIDLAERLGSNEIVSHALNNLGTARLITGDDVGWGDLNRSLQIALACDLQEHVARAYTNLSCEAVSCRRYELATRHISDGLKYCEEHDIDSFGLYILALRARARFDQGDWPGANEDAQAVLQHSRAVPRDRITALTVLGHLGIQRGDQGASSLLDQAYQLFDSMEELMRFGPLAAAFAEAAWLAEDPQAVIRAVQAPYDLASRQRAYWIKGLLALWLWRVHAIAQQPTDIPAPFALEISGDWRGAASVWKSLGCPYEYASVLAWNGTEPEQREALTVLDQLGAVPAAQILRKRMRENGVRGVPRGSRTSTRGNPLGLTRREAEILGLLSEGLRNSAIAKRLFVSTKTIDHHVSAILAKLGVSSRAEAVAMARKQSRQEATGPN
jgi:DNA-binding CsgD family transcriptional regulator/tetratricopeptide (TPR) repeat protein